MPQKESFPFPLCVSSSAGLRFELNANGSIRRIDHQDIMLNLYLGNEVEGGAANIHLRRLGDTVESIPLLGPASPTRFQITDQGLTGLGQWGDLVYHVTLKLTETTPAWFWHVELENLGQSPVPCDLIYVQDLALAHYGAIRLNEFYVSQYIDHTPLHHSALGVAVASRQNQSMGGRCPRTIIGSLSRGVSFATDALQFHGLTNRVGEPAVALSSGLPGQRLQHEHSMVCIQDEAVVLEPGASIKRGFFGKFEPDAPNATSEADGSQLDELLSLPEAHCPPRSTELAADKEASSLFTTSPWLQTRDLSEQELEAFFGKEQRQVEYRDGQKLSFFTGKASHVALRRKEVQVLRPHGHLLRSGGALIPDEAAMTSTAWMGGVFHSMVTQGHVSINRFLSTCHTYLGLFRSHGQRMFVELDGRWHQLGLPSAFEMSLDSCRWIYRHAGGLIEVNSTAPDDQHELNLTVNVRDGAPCRFLITHHVAMNGDNGSSSVPVQYEMRGKAALVRAIADSDVGRRFPSGGFVIEPDEGTTIETVAGDECLFADGVSRQQPFLCFLTAPSQSIGLRMTGELVETTVEGTADFWKSISNGLQVEAPKASALAPAAGRAVELFPWLIHNALVHYLSPRGLEQYSGGGWGTRDVCQGPVELLLALGRFEPVRDLLGRVFRQQNEDGDWPQWFMFFDRERNIRPGDSHGDIVYWPVVALSQYLSATGDASILDLSLPYFHSEGDAAAVKETVMQHVERALAVIEKRVINGTRLAAYGHGDWNDSLQPARADMRDRLCSSWTVTLNYQMLIALSSAFRRIGQNERAATFETQAVAILEEFQQTLVVDNTLAGLAYFHENGQTDFLLHPKDDKTGLSYSLLPMIHAIINDMFTPEQAEHHLALIRTHLLGPDGARLFDRPMAYHGGIQKYFQRAESASFFGREIGIMYTHAHLRYCEALARHGDAEAFFEALSKMNPIAIQEAFASAGVRQANCYYSSSDAAFTDRYDAFANYDKVNSGKVTLDGGWRVYSSGAGIATRLIMQCFLGLIVEKEALVIDPVVPSALDGMQADLLLGGHKIKVVYRVQSRGCGPLTIRVNEAVIPFTREKNLYRTGAARIEMAAFLGALTGNGDQLAIELE
jgi:1,2-beta-oligoglucan phosphorylase